MSCSSLKSRFEQLKASDNLDFNAAMNLFNDVKGSIDAHQVELAELRRKGDVGSIHQLQEHIHDGEEMMKELKNMTLH